jgi:MFS family permease
MDAVLIGWVTTAYIIASAVFLLPLGRASDLLGRKRIFISGILVFSLTSLFSPLHRAPGSSWRSVHSRASAGP